MKDHDRHTLPIGTLLKGKWVILEFIAKGGMGEIYRAHQVNIKRDVAIKVISRQWLEEISEDPEEIEGALIRFRQEVETMGQIRHPNVLHIYDFDSASVPTEDGTEEEIEYIVLEYVPGSTLRATMSEEGCYPSARGCSHWIRRYFLPILNGVQAIHEAGIYHRDLKPENVLMDGEVPKIADFGLARSCRFESKTCSTEIKGTPAYMAPEQFIDFKRTDQRTDIYSLGKILFEEISGKIQPNDIPFKQARLKGVEGPFFLALDRIIGRATEEEPQRRYQSVAEMKAAIEEALELAGDGDNDGQGPEPSIPTKGQQKADLTFHQAESHRAWQMPRQAIYLALMALLLLLGALSYMNLIRPSSHHSPKSMPASDGSEARGNTPSKDGLSADGGKKAKSVTFTLPAVLDAPDGVSLHFIRGGTIMVPADFLEPGAAGPWREAKVSPFYMDETQVTNIQYVNFLNSILGELVVEDRAVKRNGEILLYLGEAIQGYEPIIFAKGRFRVKKSSHAACPVVRITAYGAASYAEHFGRRLATKLEWIYAAAEAHSSARLPESFRAPFGFPGSVLAMSANRLGIRGLNQNFGEWVLDALDHHEKGAGYAVLGGFERNNSDKALIPHPVRRQPWEAFEEVGFRCVKDID
jgi:serine/threonine-protein kinase